MADKDDHDDGGDDGNEDVEAEAQVEFKPLIEVSPTICEFDVACLAASV
jgi:hypothetical protein